MRLNNFKIKSLPINKKISDGSGLNLTLTSRDNGNWTFRYTYNGKAKDKKFFNSFLKCMKDFTSWDFEI